LALGWQAEDYEFILNPLHADGETSWKTNSGQLMIELETIELELKSIELAFRSSFA
jgi:hypothetical protein